MPTRRDFLKCLVGLGMGSLLSWNLLPKTEVVVSAKTDSQQLWTKSQESTLTFVVVSDLHINRLNAVSHFSALLNDNFNSRPDAMVVVGDLGDGRPRDYQVIKGELNRHNLEINYPIYWTIGNHEFYKSFYNHQNDKVWSTKSFPNKETDASAVQRFLAFAGRDKVYADTWIHDYHFIFLGSDRSRMKSWAYQDLAYLSDGQLSWLAETLESGSASKKPVFVFLHQPLPYQLESGGMQHGYVIQWQRLKEILGKYPNVILFSGHTHFVLDSNFMQSDTSCTMINSSSLAVPIDRQRQHILNSAPGLVVEVDREKVFIRGRDFLRQQWISSAEGAIFV